MVSARWLHRAKISGFCGKSSLSQQQPITIHKLLRSVIPVSVGQPATVWLLQHRNVPPSQAFYWVCDPCLVRSTHTVLCNLAITHFPQSLLPSSHECLSCTLFPFWLGVPSVCSAKKDHILTHTWTWSQVCGIFKELYLKLSLSTFTVFSVSSLLLSTHSTLSSSWFPLTVEQVVNTADTVYEVKLENSEQ